MVAGEGIYLNPQGGEAQYDWDFDIDETGDLRMTAGLDELMKDVAFVTAVASLEDIGAPIRPTTLNRLHALITQVLEDDPRITEIVRLDVSEGTTPNEVDINAILEAGDENVELSFTEEIV